jgi:hypothetical protein
VWRVVKHSCGLVGRRHEAKRTHRSTRSKRDDVRARRGSN